MYTRRIATRTRGCILSGERGFCCEMRTFAIMTDWHRIMTPGHDTKRIYSWFFAQLDNNIGLDTRPSVRLNSVQR